jgi:hypothetical protein
MSQYNNKNKNQKQVVPQPFCKVCKDSDKSEAMYTSHWVKDKQGKVCCPTLLSQQCRYCNNHGHTIKFCKFAVEDSNRSKLVSKVVTKAPAVKLANNPQPSLMSNNRWSALALAEAAPAKAQALAEEYPSLSPNVTLRPHQKQFATLSFAAVAAIPLAFPQDTPKVIQKSAPVKFSRNWADDDSSDEEEEPQYDCASGCNNSIISDDEPDQEMSFYYRQQVAAF